MGGGRSLGSATFLSLSFLSGGPTSPSPLLSSHRPMGTGTQPVGSSGRCPGSIRIVAFHFFACPAPQWASHRIGVKVRSSSGRFAQHGDRQITLRKSRKNVPR